jgi:hypothetical protein
MTALSSEDLEVLLEAREGPCVSIYMPVQRSGAGQQENRIRLKNLLGEAGSRLQESGLTSQEAESFLDGARTLPEDEDLWAAREDGLALFLGPGFLKVVHVALGLEELVVVAGRFHVKPLLPLLVEGGRFYVLALSQREARLVGCTRHGVSRIELPGAPGGVQEEVESRDLERQLQFHTGTPGGSGQRPAAFHGHGAGKDEYGTRILQCFRGVDGAVSEVLAGQRAPLVLAGVEYLFPIYREVNTYPALTDEGVAGNPEELSEAELRARAWPVVEPLFRKKLDESRARFLSLHGSGRASDELEAIVSATREGRVETLFVALGARQWGHHEPATGDLRLSEGQEPNAEDLLDRAAVQTLRNGGEVYAVEPDEMPSQATLAAIYRY